jgi:hypothetical protein
MEIFDSYIQYSTGKQFGRHINEDSDLGLSRGFEDWVESLDGASGTQPLCQLVSDVPNLKRAHNLTLVTTSFKR